MFEYLNFYSMRWNQIKENLSALNLEQASGVYFYLYLEIIGTKTTFSVHMPYETLLNINYPSSTLMFKFEINIDTSCGIIIATKFEINV